MHDTVVRMILEAAKEYSTYFFREYLLNAIQGKINSEWASSLCHTPSWCMEDNENMCCIFVYLYNNI